MTAAAVLILGTHTAGDVLTKAMRLTTRMDELDERETR